MVLKPPLRDASGAVVPHDHAEIANTDDIIRRISEQQIVKVGNARRISSLAFQPSGGGANEGMSIDIKPSIEAAGLDAAQFVTTPRWTGSVIFQASAARDLQLMVGYDPLPDNVHHGEVWGIFTKAKSKALQRASQWFVAIPNTQVS